MLKVYLEKRKDFQIKIYDYDFLLINFRINTLEDHSHSRSSYSKYHMLIIYSRVMRASVTSCNPHLKLHIPININLL